MSPFVSASLTPSNHVHFLLETTPKQNRKLLLLCIHQFCPFSLRSFSVCFYVRGRQKLENAASGSCRSSASARLFLFDGGEVTLQLKELWSVLLVVLPAALHHLIHVVRATLRTRHPITCDQQEGGRGRAKRQFVVKRAELKQHKNTSVLL